ncbi:MAG: LCP family protein [Firmicutes bacterium]|nr:LCP family protein [Bacillota bacterium]
MRRFSILPHKISYGIALVLAFVAEALFMLFLIALDILPLAYLLGVIGVLVLIDLLILLLFNGKKKRDVKSLGALVIIVFMLNILLVGDYFIYSTYDTLEQISSLHDRWEYYEVIAPVDSKYQKVADIKGSEINVVDMQSKQLQEAEERLVTKGDVTYTKCDKLLDVGHKLVDKKGKVHDRLALVSKSENKLLGRNIEGYKDQTQVIYRLKVKQRADDHSKSVDVTKDSFNVLISGIDSWGTIDEGGLSDVNMVMTVNPTTREVMLTSIPRDSYVPLHSYGEKDKLTHTGIYGEEETKQTIEDLLDIDINYTIRVNFSMLCDIIDAIGGIDVYVDEDFYSAVKGWHYKKGWHHMDGHYALWFARERKSFAEGDMKRNENQQRVMKALIEKVTSSKVILTRYTGILKVVKDEMSTDLKNSDLKKLARMQLIKMRKWTVSRTNLVGSTGSAPCFSMGNQALSCVFLDEAKVEEAKERIHNTMFPVDNTQTIVEQEQEEKQEKQSE